MIKYNYYFIPPNNKKEYCCQICCKKYEKMGNIEFKKHYLDGIPKKDSLEFLLYYYEVCPHCGMVAPSLDGDKVRYHKALLKEDINEPLYQLILNHTNKTDIERIFLAREYLLEHALKYNKHFEDENIYFLLFAYYDIVGDKVKAKEYCRQALRFERNYIAKVPFSTILKEGVSSHIYAYSNSYLNCIELHRRLGEFEQALNLIELYFRNKLELSKSEKKILQKEKKLCRKRISTRK